MVNAVQYEYVNWMKWAAKVGMSYMYWDDLKENSTSYQLNNLGGTDSDCLFKVGFFWCVKGASSSLRFLVSYLEMYLGLIYPKQYNLDWSSQVKNCQHNRHTLCMALIVIHGINFRFWNWVLLWTKSAWTPEYRQKVPCLPTYNKSWTPKRKVEYSYYWCKSW